MENKTTFTIIGCGYWIKHFDNDHPLTIKLRSLKDSRPMEFLTGFRSLESLEIKDNQGNFYSSFFEFMPTKIYPVYCTDPYTRLEIRRGSTKPSKLFFNNLIRTDYLFPPNYIKEEKILTGEGLFVLEYDKGHFGSTVHPRPFELDDTLSFEIISIPDLNIKCIKTIKVNANEVILKRGDTLNYGVSTFLL